MEWITRNDVNEYPIAEGWYRVMVSGDSEQLDGHTIYAFDDYETWAYLSKNGDDEYNFKGEHDEEDFTIFAYCGPYIVPKYETP